MAEIDYQFPDVTLLDEPPPNGEQADEELLDSAARLAQKLNEFGVTGQIKHICPGPVVTTYESSPTPASGTRAQERKEFQQSQTR